MTKVHPILCLYVGFSLPPSPKDTSSSEGEGGWLICHWFGAGVRGWQSSGRRQDSAFGGSSDRISSLSPFGDECRGVRRLAWWAGRGGGQWWAASSPVARGWPSGRGAEPGAEGGGGAVSPDALAARVPAIQIHHWASLRGLILGLNLQMALHENSHQSVFLLRSAPHLV